MSRKKVLVLGGNFGGLTAALAVKHELFGDVDVRVVSASDKFLFNPFNRLLCSGKWTFTSRDTTLGNKIVICDFPLLEYRHETGRTINVTVKLIFQRVWLRRKISESPNPVFLRQNEFQYFVTRRENFFQQTCRGSQ